MNVAVKLFGTLGQHIPEYDRDCGINIEISDGAKVKDLLDHIKIHGTKGIIVVAEGKLLKPEDKLGDSCSVQIFQSVFGG